eukprot:GHVU01160526.1.p2 GENE.GHVU01160526.1~~GHVU01160526.1.p2  ORF type:complete len:110 (+),score=5.97 GHVU01160526.1:408-737(+)
MDGWSRRAFVFISEWQQGGWQNRSGGCFYCFRGCFSSQFSTYIFYTHPSTDTHTYIYTHTSIHPLTPPAAAAALATRGACLEMHPYTRTFYYSHHGLCGLGRPRESVSD